MPVVGVNVDHGDVGAEGVSEVGRVVVGGGLQARLHTPSGIFQATLAMRATSWMVLAWSGDAADEELAVVVLDVGLGGFQQVGGDGYRALSRILRMLRATAPPPTTVVRLP